MSEAKLFIQLAHKAQTALERLPDWQRSNRLPPPPLAAKQNSTAVKSANEKKK